MVLHIKNWLKLPVGPVQYLGRHHACDEATDVVLETGCSFRMVSTPFSGKFGLRKDPTFPGSFPLIVLRFWGLKNVALLGNHAWDALGFSGNELIAKIFQTIVRFFKFPKFSMIK